MKLHINGEEVSLPDSITRLDEVLRHYNLEQKMIIIEYNRKVLNKQEYGMTRMEEGDSIEIVQFVGGG